VTVAEEKDHESIKIMDNIRAAISEIPPGRAAGLLLMSMIEIANKEHWSSARLLTWFVSAVSVLEHRFDLKLEDEIRGGQTLQ
jgi:hypothetical protein